MSRAAEPASHRARPVFVDRSGRRRRLVVFTGVGLAVLLAASIGVLLVGLTGATSPHVPGFPDQAVPAASPSLTPDPGSEQTRTEAGPAASTSPGATTGSASPAAEPTSPRRIPTQTPSHDPKPSKS